MDRIKTLFGPAGGSDRFREQGHKSTIEAPKWLAGIGLDAFEYSAGRGVAVSETTARAIGAAAKENGTFMSLHAPYYINCAAPEPDKRENSIRYLLESAKACNFMGGDRVVFHVGSPKKQDRDIAHQLSKDTVTRALHVLAEEGLSHIHLCPETMGRPSQLGSLDETLDICLLDEGIIPTLDFGHLHTVGLGALNEIEDFESIVKRMIEVLGFERAQRFHAHFSRIEYTAKGEKRHWRFEDTQFGPEFSMLAPVLIAYNLTPTIICESAGTQDIDALAMKSTYAALLTASTHLL